MLVVGEVGALSKAAVPTPAEVFILVGRGAAASWGGTPGRAGGHGHLAA
ncbi:MAG: hypothetical protein J0H91_14225 [Rhodospirillales bacterium]|nr:hypothetical protein [Rhodospirillales bacterium]